MQVKEVSLNYVALEGYVSSVENVMVAESFCVKAKIRLERASRRLYMEVYGFGEVAQNMVLTCEKGNRVFIEGKFMNSIVKKNKMAVALTPYVCVTNVECLLKHKEPRKPFDKMIAVLDGIDPIRYLRKARRRNGRRKLKDDLRDDNYDEE